MIIDLSQLPEPEVIENLDFETIYQELLGDFREAMAGEWTAEVESDPVLKLLQLAAYRELLLRARINDAARAVMLAYASGADLDQIGAGFNVQRLLIRPAQPEAVPPGGAVRERQVAAQSHPARVRAAIRRRTAERLYSPCAGRGWKGGGCLCDQSGALRSADQRARGGRQRAGTGSGVAGSAPGAERGGRASCRGSGNGALGRHRSLSGQGAALPVSRSRGRADPCRRRGFAARLHFRPAPPGPRHPAFGPVRHPACRRRAARRLQEPAADVVLDETQAAYCTGYAITLGGVDE